MRKESILLLLGGALVACGGGDEAVKPAESPASQPAAATTATPTTAGNDSKAGSATQTQSMASFAESQLATMKTLADAMNAHDSKKYTSVYTDDATLMVPGMPEMHGRDAIQQFGQQLFDGSPNVKFGLGRVWQKGDSVAVEWAISGTQTGEFMGVKPTEKPMGVAGLSVLTFTPDGLVKQDHRYFDPMTVMTQLGAHKGKARPVPMVPASMEVHVAKGTPDEAKLVDWAKSMYGAMERKSETDFLATMSDDTEYNDMMQPEASKGKGDAKKMLQMMTKAFPDMKIGTNNVIAADDYVVVECEITGTHKGAFGPIAPTKKAIDLHGVDVFQVKDGKLVRGWTYGSNAELLSELGVMKAEPGKAKAEAKADARTGKDAAPAKASVATPAPAKAAK